VYQRREVVGRRAVPPLWNKQSSSGIILKKSETLMPRPSNKMRELRTALALALGLAIASFGTAIVAAAYIV
jgi:hypothetical protein